MKDRFDQLRWSPQKRGAIPDVEAIKARSRAVVRQRYQQVGAAAIALGIFVVVGITLASMPNRPAERLATDALPTIDTRTPRPAAEREGAEPSPQTAFNAPSGGGQALRSGGPASRTAPTSGGSTAGSGSGAAAPQSESAAADRASPTPPPAFRVTLEATSTGRGAHFTLHVCNVTEQSQTLRYNTGQRYDFEVYSQGSRIWRWSDDQVFTQATGTEPFRPGECNTYNDTWNGRKSDGNYAAPGQYSAVGISTSSPPQRSSAKTFTTEG